MESIPLAIKEEETSTNYNEEDFAGDDQVEIVPEDEEAKTKSNIVEVINLTGGEIPPEVNGLTESKKAKKAKKKQLSSEKNDIVPPRVAKTFVPVHRTKEIELVRSKLPIIPEEQVRI